MTTVVHTNVLLRPRGEPLRLPARRRRLSTIVRRHGPVGRRAVPLVFRDGEPWRVANRAALDRAARLRSQYRTTLVGPRDTVVFMALPLGGGGSSGGGGKTAGSIALALAAVALTAIAGPYGTAITTSIATAIGVSQLVVQTGLVVGAVALSYAASRAAAAKKKATNDQFTSVSGGGNVPKPGDRRPLVYGKCWTAPPLAQKDYFQYNGDVTTLYKRMVLGLGKFQVHQIRVGDSLLWDETTGVQAPFSAAAVPGLETAVEILYEQPSALIPGDVATSDSVGGQVLPRTGGNPAWTPWFRVTPDGISTSQALVAYQFPSLTGQGTSGKTLPASGGINYQWQLLTPGTHNPTGPVIDLFQPRLNGYSTAALHFSGVINLPSYGEWQVRAQNAYPDPGPNSGYRNDATWDELSGLIPDTAVRQKTTEIALRISSVAGLTITAFSDVQVLATRILPVWDGTAWTEQPTSKAVWAYADLVRNEYGLDQSDDALDLDKILATANRTDLAGFDTYDGVLPSVASFWEQAAQVLLPLRAEPTKVGGVYSFTRDESAAEAGGRRVLTRRQTVRDSASVTFDLATDDSTTGDVIVEFDRDGDPKRPDEVRQDKFPATRTPKRYRVDGITDGDHALHHARWLAAIAMYRGATRKQTTEWDGRLIFPGTHILSDVWYLSGKVVAGVAALAGVTLALDIDLPTLPATPYASIRTPAGREWGMVRATPSGPRSIVLDAGDVAALAASTGRSLASVLASDAQDPTTVTIGELVELQETCIARSAIPSDPDHVDIEMVLDDPRVWAILGETIVGPAPPTGAGPADILEPTIPAVHARCDTIETGIEIVWSVAAAKGAVSYTAQLSYDAGTTWETLQDAQAVLAGRSPIRQSASPLTFRARAFGVTGLPGPWASATFATVAPVVDGASTSLVNVALQSLEQSVQNALSSDPTIPGSLGELKKDAADAFARADQVAADLDQVAKDLTDDTSALFRDLFDALSPDPSIRALASNSAKGIQETLALLGDAVAFALDRLEGLRGQVYEAGLEPGPDGAYRIVGIAQTATSLQSRINAVSVSLDAAKAKIDLVASSIVSGTVDGSALFSAITTVQSSLDAMNGLLSSKAAQASVDALGVRTTAAEQAISAFGSIVQSTQAGQVAADLDLQGQGLADILAYVSQMAGRLGEVVTTTTQTLSSRIDQNGQAISESNKTILSVSGQSAAQYQELIKTIASGDAATASATAALSAQVNDPNSGLPYTLARLASEESARASGDSAVATRTGALETSVNSPTTGLAYTLARLATEESTRAYVDSVISSNVSTLSAQVNDPRYGLPSTLARLITEESTRASGDSANASRSSALETTVNNPTTGVVATYGRIVQEESNRASADSVIAGNVSSLSGQVNDPRYGLPYTLARLVTEEGTRASVDSSQASSLAALSAQVNEPNTGLPHVYAALVDEGTARASGDSAIATRTTALETTVNDPGGGVTATARALSSFYTSQQGTNTSLATSLTSVTATANGISANGTFVLQASGAPAGASAAYQLKLASNGASTGLNVLLLPDGSSRIMLDATYTTIGNGAGFAPLATFDASTGRVTIPRLTVTTQLVAPNAIFSTGHMSCAARTLGADTSGPVKANAGFGYATTFTTDGPASIDIITKLPFQITGDGINGSNPYGALYVVVDDTFLEINTLSGGGISGTVSDGKGFTVVTTNVANAGTHTVTIGFAASSCTLQLTAAGTYDFKVYKQGLAS